MPTPRIYNKHSCTCGVPFSSLRLLNSHHQIYPSHKMVNTDIVMEDAETPMQEAESPIPSENTRKCYGCIYTCSIVSYSIV